MLRRFLQSLLRWAWFKLQRVKRNLDELSRENTWLRDQVAALKPDESIALDRFMDAARDMIEARLMSSGGPGAGPPTEIMQAAKESLVRIQENALGLRESNPITAQGAFGDIELALQNVEWRREINLSWLEFSRWGIQQIILISRLYYIKNPLIRRGVDVAAVYVFGRGVEVTSTDPKANDVLKEFFERNKKTFGNVGLTEQERRKYYDGNLFWCFFPDTQSTGLTDVRTIDATEIQEIVCDPDDVDKPQLYRREWTQKVADMKTGNITNVPQKAWYPALGWDAKKTPKTINGVKVMWNNPVLHRRCGAVAKWHFGCPIVYPALDWAKAARKFLESCATVKQSLAQIAWHITTKGGQQAIEGVKQQLQTNVNSQPGNSIWDTNPTAVNASILASGPGTTLTALNASGKGGDPEEVRRFIHWVAMVFGVPETFFSDVSTGNLATATTLDRPTELNFRSKQMEWEDDLSTIAKFVLDVSLGATAGALRESVGPARKIRVIEMARKLLPNGEWVYEAKKPGKDEILVRVTFPAIREGDLPAIVGAIVQAMTLGNKGGQVTGIDAKRGNRLLYETLGEENPEDAVEEQFPEATYDPDRTKEEEPAVQLDPATGEPIPAIPVNGGPPVPQPPKQEAARRLLAAVESLKEASRPNGNA